MMEGIELVKNIAEIERQLAEKLSEARRSAELRIEETQEESKRLVAEAEAQIRRMDDLMRTRVAEESARIAEETEASAEQEAHEIREQASINIDRAVDFIVSKVLP